MDTAAKALLGHHDFTTFRSINCQSKSPIKTLDAISVTRTGDNIEIRLAARSFMHRQVRSIAGSLKFVGEGKWPVAAMAEVLTARDRSQCGAVAPAAGLYLTRVDYPDDSGILGPGLHQSHGPENQPADQKAGQNIKDDNADGIDPGCGQGGTGQKRGEPQNEQD